MRYGKKLELRKGKKINRRRETGEIHFESRRVTWPDLLFPRSWSCCTVVLLNFFFGDEVACFYYTVPL